MKKADGRTTAGRSIRSLLSTITGTALVATALVAGSAAGASAAPQFPGGSGGQVSFEPGRYIVTLVDNAVATYGGGVNGFSATKPKDGDQLNARRGPVQDYSNYLETKQEKVAAAVGADINASYTMAINAFSANLSSEQAAALVASKDVATITPDELHHVTATPSTEFLGLEGAGGVWEQIGGADQAGSGVVVGVLDTGIAPENPAFAGDALGTTAGSDPYLSGANAISFVKGDGQTFTGTCQEGTQFTVEDCSTKIITARYYVDGFGVENIGDASTGPGEFASPRDGDGHGSHTASTAAGNYATPASINGIDFGVISGVAPAAKIAAYKVCWSGPDPAVDTDDGCTTTDLLAGIDQAVADGVDVINFSIGGSAAGSTFEPTDAAFLGAATAGVFVAASAGNDGPGASTLDNAAPWITTVAATTIPSYEATATFGDGQAFAGASITVNMDPAAEPLTGNLVNSTAVGSGTDANLCAPNSLDAASVQPGTIIVCERGVYDRVAKSAEVARVGGIGMLLVNVNPGSIDTDFHSVPTVHLSHTYHDAVVAYAATAGATVTFTTGNALGTTPPVPQVAGFSSRGPLVVDGSDILKPDIAAPGVSILAAGSNGETVDPTFKFLSGTSMASPHIAGIAALYLGERPNATPAEIKSAMMTTAYDLVDNSGAAVNDPFAQGAGHADPTRFFEPGLLYLNGQPDWYAYLQGLGYDAGVDPIDASNLNLASISIGSLTAPETITRTVTATESGTFNATIEGLAGIDATVAPASFTIEAGQSQSFTITFSRTDAPLDEFATGSLVWSSASTTVRSPIAVQPVTIVAPSDVDGAGISGSVDIEVTPGGTGDIPLSTTGLSLGELLEDPTGTETEHSGSGVTGDAAEYEVEVPEGATFARFDLDAVDELSDLDLIVYLLDKKGDPIAGWQSATGSADERVDLIAPEAGTYLLLVDVFAANPATAWDMVVSSVVPGGAPLALTPPVLSGEQGVPVTFTASWADLAPESTYLGLVSYGETGAFTVLQVETGEAVAPVNLSLPTISGTAEVGKKLTADPGEWDTAGLQFSYQWQSNGVDIKGATKSTYKVTKKDAGATITVVVTATKGDVPPGTATSEGVVVKAGPTKGTRVIS